MAAGEAAARYRGGGVDIGERTQHERAFVHSRVRDREPRDANAPPAEQQNVDVERSGRVAA